MPNIAATDAKRDYDVIVIGSGATGSQFAYTLTLEGIRVLMLEAGRHYDPARETPMFQLPHQAPLRGTGTLDKPEGFYDATTYGSALLPDEPYTNANSNTRDQREVIWWRTRMLGGRTNHWGRLVLRCGPDDFRQHSIHGVGYDWPLSYDELAPYYDKVEMLIGVMGAAAGIDNAPDSPPGVLQAPPTMRVGEQYLKKHAARIGVPVVAAPRAVLGGPLDHRRIPAKLHPHNPRAQKLVADSMRSRATCLWATPCHRGCGIGATYQAPTVHLPPALASGNLDVVTNAMAREITVNRAGLANGVVFVDRVTGREYRTASRAVVVAGGAFESVRLLLNSTSAAHAHGIGHSHGRLGRQISATASSAFSAQIPGLEGLPPINEDGAGGAHAYIPWWLAAAQRHGRLDFASGYHMELSAGRAMPENARNIAWLTKGSYGARFKEDQRRFFGSFIGLLSESGMVPNEDTYCEIDPTVKDKWGIPVLRFHWRWGEIEARTVEHQQRSMAAIVDALGGRTRQKPETDGFKAVRQPSGGHEVGGAGMGRDRASSVTNAFGQVWDAPNVFVGDGALFPTSVHKNPTLTMMALAWRNADHLVDQFRKRAL